MADARAENQDLIPGMLLGGKYRLEQEIGRGAMGTVWRAKHESLDQRVAVKVISQEHANSEELRRRFDTEARAAAKLRSRFVVGVFDNGVTKHGLPYIVMEYLEGECLEDRIARQGSISVAETARVARHVSRALSRAHSRGIVHRDLKPANIFITKSDDEDDDASDWIAKVLDFGIAKMDDFGDRSTTKTGTVLGTPLFMSPEQVRGASTVDSRADIYSFGMVIYNMLTGTYAFEGQSFGDLLVSICTDPLPDLSRSAPQAPPALNAWFQKVCARDPKDRYQTADEAMNGLADAIGDTAPNARMSMVDVSSTEIFAPLAETYASSSEVTQSGSRPLEPRSSSSMGAAMTISVGPKKSPLPYIVGGGALAVALVVFFAVSPSDDAKPGANAQQATAAEIKGDSPADTTPEVGTDPKKAPASPEDVATPRDVVAPTDSAPSGTPEKDTSVEPSAAPTGKPPTSAGAIKPASLKPAPKPAPQVAPTVSAPAPQPAPQAAPKPAPKPSLDLGF